MYAHLNFIFMSALNLSKSVSKFLVTVNPCYLFLLFFGKSFFGWFAVSNELLFSIRSLCVSIIYVHTYVLPMSVLLSSILHYIVRM